MARRGNCFVDRLRQTRLILKKNFIIMFRNVGSTVTQIVVPIVFVALLFLLDKAARHNFSYNEDATEVRTSNTIAIGNIPHCVLQPGQERCWSFGYTPSTNPTVVEIIKRIQINEGISDSEVIPFRTESEADAFLYANPNSTFGVYHIQLEYTSCLTPTGGFTFTVDKDECLSRPHPKSDVAAIRYSIQYNSTTITYRGRSIDTRQYVQIPMIYAIDRAIFETFHGEGLYNVSVYRVGLRKYPHPEQHPFNTISVAGPFIFFAALMFNFVIQVGTIVSEKEMKLRESMEVMGLKDSVYWFSWLVVNFVMNFIAALLLITAGAAFQLPFFLRNDFGTYFFLFILFGLSMVPVAFVVSTLLTTSSTATTVGFVIFLVGSLIQYFSPVIYDSEGNEFLKVIFSLFPFVLLAKGLQDLSDATDSAVKTGIRWSEIATHKESFPLQTVYLWLLIDFAIYLVVGLLMDQILYHRRAPWFFLLPSYWKGRSPKLSRDNTAIKEKTYEVEGMDEDVLAVEEAIKCGNISTDAAVVIKCLEKTYVKKKCCCIPDKEKTFRAVKGISLTIEQGQLLCLLGHNGAGKTTTIGMLTGLIPPTAGDATIFGKSIVDSMDEIRALLGICPQHDILFGALTAREHLELFAGLKGFTTNVNENIEKCLKDVGLEEVADIPAANFSGGMKRRLSVCIALVGDPKFVILDEPTTGMDTIARREVWNLIERIKRDRVTLLTTHSMEEADILGDNIAIMKAGFLASIGTSLRLKKKYGSGYSISIVGDSNRSTATLNFVKSYFGRLISSDYHTMVRKNYYKVRKERIQTDKHTKDWQDNSTQITQVISGNTAVTYCKVSTKQQHLLPFFFEDLDANKNKLKVKDYQVAMTTLEEVFLKVAEEREPIEMKKQKSTHKKRRCWIGVGIAVGLLALIAVAVLLIALLARRTSSTPVAPSRSAEPVLLPTTTVPINLNQFPFAVLVGDVTPSSAIISARLLDDVGPTRLRLWRAVGTTQWQELAPDSNLFSSRELQNASSTSMKLQLTNLEPDTAYVVQLEQVSRVAASPMVRFRSALHPNDQRRVVFGATSALGKTNSMWANLAQAAKEKFDFFLLLGDTVYAPSNVTLANYANLWGNVSSHPSFRELAQSTSIVATWNENELGQAAWYNHSQYPNFDQIFHNATNAMLEALPITLNGYEFVPGYQSGLWRSLRWGRTVEVFVLDTRTEHQLAEPGNLTSCKQMISPTQMDWLKRGLIQSEAKFKIVASPMPITNMESIGTVILESWQMCPEQRNELINYIVNNFIQGVLFVSGGAQFGGIARVEQTPDPIPQWSPYNVTEVLVGPSGTFINEAVIMNSYLALDTQFSAIIDTWTYTRFELDPVRGTIEVKFIDDGGIVVSEEILEMFLSSK